MLYLQIDSLEINFRYFHAYELYIKYARKVKSGSLIFEGLKQYYKGQLYVYRTFRNLLLQAPF